MKLFNQLALILGIWAIGEYISSFIQNIIVIPGNIIGMILLFLLLQFKVIKLDKVNELGDLLINNMAIFFVPAGVSLIRSLDLISDNIFVLLMTIFFSTIAVMYITGFVVEKMINNKPKEEQNV
ncbi:CidA/LrgA family protein [Romboutsia ilealis]|uniref:CidA/LrgA family protein n=1 Tax=Romboutsia faecis TaxID=2764597 RepID=A0ABR7JS44_9FIRM|nr:CidA/LrgA family protein [Romboutsia faecis]MBC5997729.1 CidA/LrgA family protein [Romboutsia faecis]MDU2197904.1 CidA/LrgA family protein [Peptostreptococcaceae bacterium]MRN25323.1 CidA/LrgA family protein [Romboutsia ilealis]